MGKHHFKGVLFANFFQVSGLYCNSHRPGTGRAHAVLPLGENTHFGGLYWVPGSQSLGPTRESRLPEGLVRQAETDDCLSYEC